MRIPKNWTPILNSIAQEPFYTTLTEKLQRLRDQGQPVYPPSDKVFAALEALNYEDVKIVILGQDPYHGEGQALGLAFAVPNELKPKPPSLKNIFKEIESDLGVSLPTGESDLSGWVEQGVLLLNTVLTVEANRPLSHRGMGWEQLTDRILSHLNQRKEPLIFVLWGSEAQKKKSLLTDTRHSILEAAHPSPLSAYRGFFGCKHFSQINQALIRRGQTPIDWKRVSNAAN